eukprot:1822238-Rhodomonas_salina.1
MRPVQFGTKQAEVVVPMSLGTDRHTHTHTHSLSLFHTHTGTHTDTATDRQTDGHTHTATLTHKMRAVCVSNRAGQFGAKQAEIVVPMRRNAESTEECQAVVPLGL